MGTSAHVVDMFGRAGGGSQHPVLHCILPSTMSPRGAPHRCMRLSETQCFRARQKGRRKTPQGGIFERPRKTPENAGKRRKTPENAGPSSSGGKIKRFYFAGNDRFRGPLGFRVRPSHGFRERGGPTHRACDSDLFSATSPAIFRS